MVSGKEYLQLMADGKIPPAPIAALFDLALTRVGDGEVEFTCLPGPQHYNPIGVVHGGLVCTVLDSALACAVHTTLPAGMAYTSIEIKVNYLRPVTSDSGLLTCVGRVVKPGRRVAFAEGEVVDASGKVVATATSSCLIFPAPAQAPIQG